MTGRTHAIVPLAVSAWLGYVPPMSAAFTHPTTALAAVTAAMVGGLLPDVDEPHSTLGGEIPGGRLGRAFLAAIALYLGFKRLSAAVIVTAAVLAFLAFVPHRGVTHSLLAMAAVGLAVSRLAGATVWVPFLVGYGSHLALDMLTPEGAPLLWPLKTHVRVPLGRTGGSVDWGLRLAALAVFVAVWVGALPKA